MANIINVLPHFVLLQIEAWRNVAGHELQVQTKWIITIIILWPLFIMSYMHTADLVLHKWNKKPCTSTTEKKTSKQGQESEGKKRFLHLLDQLLSPCRVFLLPQGQWCLAHLGLYPVKTKIKNSTWSHDCIIKWKLILINYRASFKKIVIWEDMNSLYKNHVVAEQNTSSRQSHCVATS